MKPFMSLYCIVHHTTATYLCKIKHILHVTHTISSNDYKILVQEFMTICKNLTDEQVRVAFEKFDTSGDDRLDYREFCEMINKREED